MLNNLKIGKKNPEPTPEAKAEPEDQPETRRTYDPNNPQPSFQEAMKIQQPEESSSEGLNTFSQATSEEPTHFDSLIHEAEESEAALQISGKMLSQDQFRASFIGLHGMASSFSGIEALALPNSRINDSTAHEIADTLYETILDVPMLHFLLQPGNKWLGRALIMGVYVQGMRGAIMAERAARQKPKADFSKAKKATSHKTARADGELTPDQFAALTGA